MAYNMTNITASNDIYNIVFHTNELSGGLFYTSFMLIIFILFLVVFKKNSFKKAMLAGSFFMVVLGTYGFVMNFIGLPILIGSVILNLGSLIVYYFVE